MLHIMLAPMLPLCHMRGIMAIALMAASAHALPTPSPLAAPEEPMGKIIVFEVHSLPRLSSGMTVSNDQVLGMTVHERLEENKRQVQHAKATRWAFPEYLP